MKNISKILFSSLILFSSFSAKCDFADYWYVYYNGVQKLKCNAWDTCSLILNRESLTANDTVKIIYTSDWGADSKIEKIVIRDSLNNEIYIENNGAVSDGYSWLALAMPASILRKSGKNLFHVYMINRRLGREPYPGNPILTIRLK